MVHPLFQAPASSDLGESFDSFDSQAETLPGRVKCGTSKGKNGGESALERLRSAFRHCPGSRAISHYMPPSIVCTQLLAS